METSVRNNFLKDHGVVQMYLSNILYIDFSQSFDGRTFMNFTTNLTRHNIFPFVKELWTFRKAPILANNIKRTFSFGSYTLSPRRVAPLLRTPSKQLRHLVNL